MGKEINVIDTPAADNQEVVIQSEVIKLDDMSLALVGGGTATVLF